MRLISTILSAVLLFSLVFCCVPFAFADEEPTEPTVDYSDYDWENFSIIGLDDSTWSAMCDWFRNDGDLHTIFFVAQRTDGYATTDISCIMSQRFMADPETFLYALAKEDDNIWKNCVDFLLFETYNWDTMADVLESVELSGPDAEKGYEILAYMIDCAKQEYGKEVHNPHTGDSVGVFVALLVVSGLSGAVLLTQRKRFIA